MNTQSAADLSSTNLPPAERCERQVAEARRMFQRTLAKWASDVLILRHQRLTEPTWEQPAGGSMALIDPGDGFDAWTQAA